MCYYFLMGNFLFVNRLYQEFEHKSCMIFIVSMIHKELI
jgi:hypothetical protein